MTDKKNFERDVTDQQNLGTDGLENRVKGTAEELKGKARNALGALTGDTSEQIKGKGEELKGKAQQGLGRAQQNVDDAIDRNDRQVP